MTPCARGAQAVRVPLRRTSRRRLSSRSVGALRRALVCALLVGTTLLGPRLASPATADGIPPTDVSGRTTVGTGAPTDATTPSPTPIVGLPPVRVTVTAITPRVVQPGQDLTVTATIINTGSGTLAEPHVLVHLDRRGFVTRTSLDRWRQADPMADAGPSVLEVTVPGPLAPGGTATVVATIPASSLGQRPTPTSWGARALALEVVDHADPSRLRQGIARTFALWFPEQDVTSTEVTVLVPVVGPEVDPGTGAWVNDLEALTTPGGRLAELLRGTADHHDVTWVLDPWLLDATATPLAGAAGAPSGSSADPTPSGGPVPTAVAPTTAAPQPAAGPHAQAWSTALLRATSGRDVRLLPYGDPDVVALAHAGARDLFDRATRRAKAVASSSGLPDGTASTIAWPGVDLPDLATASFLARDATRTIVVGPGRLPPAKVPTYTPTGKATIFTAAGDVTALVPDDRLSTALTTGLVASPAAADAKSDAEVTAAPWRALASSQLTGATAGQDLLAELAVITRERPNEIRRLLVTVPRDWQPDGAVLDAQLTALSSAPWVRPQSVSTLIGSPESEVERGTLPAHAALAAEISASRVDALRVAVTGRADLATMVPDPAGLIGDLAQELLTPLSVAWRADPTGRDAVITRVQTRTEALRGAVTVDPGTVVNLISTTAGLPVRLRNRLDQPATVSVSLQSSNGRLRADAPVKVTIPAHGQQTALIPVHAIQSADLNVGVEVRTPDGVLVDAQTSLPVRVRAEWEGIGTAVIAGFLALGVVIGLIRTIRRGRTSRRGAPVVAGPDALSPEETEAAADAPSPEAVGP